MVTHGLLTRGKSLPFAALPQCPIEDPVGHHFDEARPLRDGDEAHREQQTALRMVPSQQDFGTGHETAAQMTLRLIVELELISLDAAPHLDDQG